MNPQDQDQTTTPLNDTAVDTPSTQPEVSLDESSTPPVELPATPEADAAALQAIDALESEGVTVDSSVSAPAVDPVPVEPMTPTSPDPTPTITSPVTPEQQQDTAPTTAVEASAAGAAAAVGAQAGQTMANASQAPVTQPASSAFGSTQKKAVSKPTLILIAVVGVLILAVAGFFIWQAMNPTTTAPTTTNTTQTTDTTTGGDQPGGDETPTEPTDTAQ